MTPRLELTLAVAALVVAGGLFAPAADAQPSPRPNAQPAHSAASRACPPRAKALGYSDDLNKLVHDGVELGGLSSLAHDRRSHGYVSAVDNNGTDPERIWFFRDLAAPHVTRDPLVLKMPDGTPYTGENSDNEGLAVLPDGDFLVSSETEPSIRIYRRDGVQRAELPVPARFDVTGTNPKGQATDNATLEGLTISPDGREVVASMEGALSGDVSSSGDATYHRFLVYRAGRHGWRLAKQIGYRAGDGMRIPEVALYGRDNLLVEEAAYSSTTGNAVELYAVRDVDRAKNVSRLINLSDHPKRVVHKTLISNLVDCPTLGAPAKETQTNPLLDNYEGMAVTGSDGHDRYGVSLISDDNFSSDQTTRVLDLEARLPGRAGRYTSGDESADQRATVARP